MSDSDDELRSLIIKYAAQNAAKHGGKADQVAVIGKIVSERPDLKPKLKEILPLVKEVCDYVTNLTPEKQKELAGEFEEKKKQEIKLPPLEGAETGRVVTRFAPNPNSVLHLGSSRAAILSYEYTKLYKGKFILRFEDTDPRLKRSDLKYYKYIEEDLQWLGIKWDEEYYQSERLPIYYDYVEKAIKIGAVYITECDRQKFKEYVMQQKPCPDRELSVKEQIKRWEKMLSGEYKEGEAVVRVKTDLSHPNPAVRDWPALRIIDTERYAHPIVGNKYRVWPLYNWASAIDDHLMGITHIFRGQEHFVNMVRQKYLYSAFGWKYPYAVHYGRLMIEGKPLSKSEIEKGIKTGIYSGYDDIKLATLRALKRRGIMPEAIKQLVLSMGINTNDAIISMENLYAINRKLIDPVANRYFAVFEPYVKISLKNVEVPKTVQLYKHPNRKSEIREITLSKAEIILEKNDYESNLGKNVRFMGLGNFVLKKDYAEYTDNDLMRAKEFPHLHWLPSDITLKISVLTDDGSELRGLAETGLKDEIDKVVQLERKFFCKIESMENGTIKAIYTSK
ncbi:MAG: glutamate--tRNA ligase [Nitrososphaeria archaeon]|nr:glutamate--tRNA ligase [Conexivisphaerales archaeon]